MTVRVAAPEPLRLATHAMGTRFELVLGDARSASLRAAGEAALEEIVQCHRRLTRFASDSLLSHLHRVAWRSPVRLDADTFELFETAQTLYVETGGAFDIAVGDRMDVLLGRAAEALPGRGTAEGPPFMLDAAARTIRLRDATVSLDLGAIAKGHALDLAARVLRENGVDLALLHGGTSSVIALGAPPSMDGWRVRIAPYENAPVVRLCDRALSVSCAAGARDGHGRAHLLDPRAGRPVESTSCAAVLGPSARGADAWATALAVLGERPAALGAEWETWFLEPAVEAF